MSDKFDVLVIGAGPTGMACAIEAQRAGFSALLVDKGCLVNSLFHYPANLTFFTTPELLEIGDIPFPSANQKPTRLEALEYYRAVAQHYKLAVRQYELVERVTGSDGAFVVHTRHQRGDARQYAARKLIVATGYHPDFDFLQRLGVRLAEMDCRPECHPQTLESNVSGIYLAGVIVAGSKTSEIFIENGRLHGKQIAEDLKNRLTPA